MVSPVNLNKCHVGPECRYATVSETEELKIYEYGI